ncbi:DinB family protein [Cohnella sp. WQ 127256]|uniref:DinB family protein n=1 Tax=Cohnella sp. WQ 127256 TaxID=2938790 RepID=UPI0021188B05|nr:DinB family protein [Cohnella sp. WQ 127256]
MIARPESHEYIPLIEKYLSLVPEGNLVEIMMQQHDDTLAVLKSLSEEQASYRYAEGKWSIKQVVGHIADVERLWNYRILRIARGDSQVLSGYNRDVFTDNSPFELLPASYVIADYSAVRKSTITLVDSLTEDALLRQGEFNEYPLSARAAAFFIAGHETHHMQMIRTKYLG